jgi:hypothetical protein
MKKALIFLLLVFAFNTIAQTETKTAAWQVKKYDLTVSLPQNPADRAMNVKAVLSLQNVGNAAGSRITLRVSDKAEVAAVKVNDAAVTSSKGEEKIGSSSRNLQRIIITMPSASPGTSFSIAVDYKLKVEENSGLNALSPVGSQFLPLSFWYPTPNSWYNLRGADHAPFRLQVNAGSETVLSSGLALGNTFEQKLNSQPFFVTGSWDAVESDGMTAYVPKGVSEDEKKRAQELLALAAGAKTFTSGLLGSTPDAPVRLVAVKRGAGFADAGIILLDYASFRRQKIDAQTAMTIAESIVKIWLGNQRQVRGEGFGVITEGLAKYVANQFIEKQFGKDVADAERLRQRTAYSNIVRTDLPLSASSPLDGTYYTSVSTKGAMVWRLLAQNIGPEKFWQIAREQLQAETFNLKVFRAALAAQGDSAIMDYLFDQVTDMDMMVGLPQTRGAEQVVALRNSGGIDANVTVSATTDKGEKLTAQTRVPARGFSEAVFKTSVKIVRVEVDAEKLYPQTDVANDIVPKEFTESNLLVTVKRNFDSQKYAEAEKNARTILNFAPRLDEARTWLGRALILQNKTAEADKEFKAALAEKLPTAFTLAWANLGLGEIAAKTGQNAAAVGHFTQAVKADAEYGSTLAARSARAKVESGVAADDDGVKAFFTQFDKAVLTGRKSEVDAFIMPGEITRFSGGAVAGQPEVWQTRVARAEKLDANRTMVETELTVRRLGAAADETGTAVFMLAKMGNVWKLAGVEVFEVR